MKIKLFGLFIFILLVVGIAGGVWHARQAERLSQQTAAKNAKAPEATIKIIEGWDNNDIAKQLENKNIIPAKDFIAIEKPFDTSAYPILADKPIGTDLEGFLFPDTYQVFTPTAQLSQSQAASLVIKKMLDNFALKFTPEMQAKAKTDNMSVYQIVTLASIIEKESGHSQEDRNIIAGIFYNRLAAGIALQSDATVNFATGGSNSSVSTGDTQVNSPYNTYLFKGLPPGPICNPSLSSIMAALFPIKTNYLYFLTDPNSGVVYYATTYEEHLANKAKYLK
jgi:UPF0755 protein